MKNVVKKAASYGIAERNIRASEVDGKNRFYRNRFRETPVSRRILLLPQCLRNHKRCKAEDIGWGYVCRACGACKLARLIAEARELGYLGSYILKGGRAIEHVLRRNRAPSHKGAGASPRRPKSASRTVNTSAQRAGTALAVLGVACHYEGAMGIAQCEKRGLTPQFVPLLRDGCVNTDVNWSRLRSVLRLGLNS